MRTRASRPRILRIPHVLLGAMSLLLASGCVVIRVFTWTQPGEHRRNAESLRSEAAYDAAVQEYLQHIDERLADTGRPEEENPYFYYIFIGDIYLEQGSPARALGSYGSAMQQGVPMEFIIDRYRRIAQHYEEKGEIQRAIDFLTENKAMDELLFEAEIDRLHKKLVAEDIERQHSGTITHQ